MRCDTSVCAARKLWLLRENQLPLSVDRPSRDTYLQYYLVDESPPGATARLRSGDSGNRSCQPHASAWGTGLAKEPSLQRTDGAPPSGGDPRKGLRSRPVLRISVLGGPIGRDGLAGSRKDTPGCCRKLRLPGQERRFVASVRTPRGRGFGRALSGFCASGIRRTT
jgi:hypothetical protein